MYRIYRKEVKNCIKDTIEVTYELTTPQERGGSRLVPGPGSMPFSREAEPANFFYGCLSGFESSGYGHLCSGEDSLDNLLADYKQILVKYLCMCDDLKTTSPSAAPGIWIKHLHIGTIESPYSSEFCPTHDNKLVDDKICFYFPLTPDELRRAHEGIRKILLETPTEVEKERIGKMKGFTF